MAQIAKVVDLTRGFVATDPNAFPENMGYTAAEDNPEKEPPILAFEGYNFLPTAYGYKSYFGTSSLLNIQALPARSDELIVYQFATLENIIIALCEDGIYTCHPTIAANVWTKNIALTLPPVGTYKEWTWTLISNTLYLYRQGESLVYTIAPTGINITTKVVTVGNIAPNFLNMAGQLGIFRANGRLGFWDSANSVSWSSLFDLADFTPAAETLAGNCTFMGVSGKIVTIVPQGDGYVIYSTRGIVGVRYSSMANILWEGNTITENAGISYPFQVTKGLTELEHFAYTSSGIKRIGNYNALNRSHQIEEVLTDIYDFLKESRTPVHLKLINGRYLMFSVTDNTYIDGKTTFTYNTIDSVYVRILFNDGVWDGIEILPAYIAGQSVSSHIAGQLSSPVYEGMYLQWYGTGECMQPARTSPIKPYNLDSTSNHVPNTGLDYSSWYSAYDIERMVRGVIGYTDWINPIPSPVALGLGWTYPGLGNVGSAFKGVVDGGLTELIATQVAEWTYFADLQVITKAAIEGATPYVAPTVPGVTPYVSSAAAQAQIDILVAAGGGTGNSYFTEVGIGTMLSGAGTTAAGIITGAGTNYATYSRSRTFLGGWDIKRRTTRTYSIRSVANMHKAVLIYIPNDSVTANGTPVWSKTIYGFGATDVDALADAVNKLLAEVPATITWVNGTDTYVISSPLVIAGNHVKYAITTINGVPGAGSSQFNLSSTTYSLATAYYVDYVDVKSIPPLTANPTVTRVSSITAAQKNLKWAYFPLGTPTGNYTSQYGAINVPGTSLAGASLGPLEYGITYPGSTHLMQDGAAEPIYPTYLGALVLDLALKKWGKLKASYKAFLDYNPINDIQAAVSYTRFGMDAGMLEATGTIKLFDARPADSWIRYGKIGYYRLGMTQLHEVRVHFRNTSTGIVTVDSSFDGRALELIQTGMSYFTTQASHTFYCSQIGRWHTIKISGQYDLQFLEVRGTVVGRR